MNLNFLFFFQSYFFLIFKKNAFLGPSVAYTQMTRVNETVGAPINSDKELKEYIYTSLTFY